MEWKIIKQDYRNTNWILTCSWAALNKHTTAIIVLITDVSNQSALKLKTLRAVNDEKKK